MSRSLIVQSAGPAMSVQDQGRPGYRAQGLTIGGAADRTALYEGAALLGQSADLATIEMAGSGGNFVATEDLRIALTGATMTATISGEPVVWNASHLLPAGAVLGIGGALKGTYGYLHVGGGFDTPLVMGARGSHLAGGIGQLLHEGDLLSVGADTGTQTAYKLPPADRFAGGLIRIVASMQTADFTPETVTRFNNTSFRRDARANRMGVRMDMEGEGFSTPNQLSIVSEIVVPGDIQISGDGAPYVLMYECQTTGGYPRIGSVLPCDVPRVAQAPIGASLHFQMLDMAEAIAVQSRAQHELTTLASKVTPLVRDPAMIRDLLRYQLISGAVSAAANPLNEEV